MPNISTGSGKLRSYYFRPELRSASETWAKCLISLPNVVELSPNMWRISIDKAYGSRSMMSAEVLIRRKDGYYLFRLPTLKNGSIPMEILAERLLDVESGDKQGHIRNVMIDIATRADTVYSPTEMAGLYEWYLYPNESDIKKLDDPDSMIVTLLGKTATARAGRAVIVGGSPQDRERIAFDLTHNFTVPEKRIISNCIIEIGHAGKGYAGYFSGKSDSQGKPLGVPKIFVDKDYVRTSDVIIHESIHALRQFDASRDERLKHVKNYWGKDADLEESLTEAETVTRQRPFEKQDSTAGYYHHIKIPDKSTRDIVISDRVTVTDKPYDDPKGGLKGKRAQKTLLLKYPATYISHLKMKGNVEAIDTFYELPNKGSDGIPGQGETTHIQIYNPEGDGKSERSVESELREIPSDVYQWQDGKKVRIKKYQSKSKRKSSSQTSLKGIGR